MKVTYNHVSLKKHGISPEQIDETATSPATIECELSPSERGNQRIMLVGFASDGRLLEIGIEFFYHQERMHFFHISPATRPYRKEFAKRIKQ